MHKLPFKKKYIKIAPTMIFPTSPSHPTHNGLNLDLWCGQGSFCADAPGKNSSDVSGKLGE
jgi:hypothetical protein